MPITPIDLGTMFMQLGQVARDEAVNKTQTDLKNSIKVATETKKAEEDSEVVNPNADLDDADSHIIHEEQRNSNRDEPEKKKVTQAKKTDDDANPPEPKLDIPHEEYLGTHIDISG